MQPLPFLTNGCLWKQGTLACPTWNIASHSWLIVCAFRSLTIKRSPLAGLCFGTIAIWIATWVAIWITIWITIWVTTWIMTWVSTWIMTRITTWIMTRIMTRATAWIMSRIMTRVTAWVTMWVASNFRYFISLSVEHLEDGSRKEYKGHS